MALAEMATSPNAWLDQRMASRIKATSGRAIMGSNVSTAWCSLVSIQSSQSSPNDLLRVCWGSRRRMPPIRTTLLPPSSRATSFTSAAGSWWTDVSTGRDRARQEPIDLPENQSEATRRIVHIRDDVDDRQQQVSKLASTGGHPITDQSSNGLDDRRPVLFALLALLIRSE